jgi:hypothetical protein
MKLLDLKLRMIVLWIWAAIAISAHSCLAVFQPGMIEKVMSGEMAVGPGMMVFMAFFWLIPLIMAFLSTTLKDRANKWTNRILSIIIAILSLFHFYEHIMEPIIEQILIVGSTVVVSAFLIFYSWKWPVKEA